MLNLTSRTVHTGCMFRINKLIHRQASVPGNQQEYSNDMSVGVHLLCSFLWDPTLQLILQ